MILSYAKRFYYFFSLRFTARAFSAWRFTYGCAASNPPEKAAGEDRFYAGIPAVRSRTVPFRNWGSFFFCKIT